MKMSAILSVNSGSSTIKFALYPLHDRQVDAASMSGIVEGLEPGGQPCIRLDAGDIRQQFVLEDLEPDADGDSFAAVLKALRELIGQHSAGIRIAGVAHRIVHGGARYAESVLIDDDTMTYLRTLNTLAPLHQPHNLDGVLAFQKAYPEVPQIACFDTGFHAQMPVTERTIALPQSLREEGICRYGFHGLSYRYVAGRLRQNSDKADQRVLMAHLGNGASVCAMKEGRSVATTMGFSALDGLMMGTRCGALDPGVILHLLQAGWNAKQLEKTLYKESGLLGVSGISADMRTLRSSGQAQAQAAIDLFTYRVIREAGALTACLNGVDVFAFTGGIGEHDAILRQQVGAGLEYLGVRIDQDKNIAARGDEICAIHASDSRVEIWVVPTDEGRIAAMDAFDLLFPG
jgi:acetate kinase